MSKTQNEKNVAVEENEVILPDGEIATEEVEEKSDKTLKLFREVLTTQAGLKYNKLTVKVPILGKIREARCVVTDNDFYDYLDAVFGENEAIDMSLSVNVRHDANTNRKVRSLGLKVTVFDEGIPFTIPFKGETAGDREILNFAARKLGLYL